MVRILRESNNELKEMPLECIKGATLLSKEEAENLLTRKERMCKGTQEAINNGLKVYLNGCSCYWLRSAGDYSDNACYVYRDGVVLSACRVYNLTYVGIRPALTISNLSSSNLKVRDSFEFGGYTFKIISNSLALCDVIIDTCPFNKSINDGNNYGSSYIKDKVDDWFNLSMQDAKDISQGRRTAAMIADEDDLGF